jgi:predicted CxxxxCH...CXXCH cytochrome family protein
MTDPTWCRRLLGLAALAALSACGEARPVEYAAPICPSWKQQMAQVFSANCAGCHSGASPAGGYDVTSYLNAIAGDAPQKLTTVLDPATATAPHRGFADLAAQMSTWAGTCKVAYVSTSVHPGGIMNPVDPQFHGAQIAAAGWSMDACTKCHGADFGGGNAKVACTSCHKDPGGPTACTTCHGQPPASGAHLAHVAGATLGKPLGCAECHKVPSSWTDVGHIVNADGQVQAAPVITFGATAQLSVPGTARSGPPSFDAATGSCQNVYCHGGDVFGDSHAAAPRPNWRHPTGTEADCGGCHGRPPSTHAANATDCNQCHQQTVDASGKLDRAKHFNGTVDLGDGSGTCTACHGNAGRPLSAPHQSHLAAPHHLRGPLPCTDCHVVPTNVNDPGHIDTGAPVVFPNVPAFTGLARADSATPTWDAANLRCSGTYCHGGGSHLVFDTAPGQNRQPTWTVGGPAQVYCGSCHGAPPSDFTHLGTFQLSDCHTCHSTTVDAFGNVLAGGAHINGSVDVVQ